MAKEVKQPEGQAAAPNKNRQKKGKILLLIAAIALVAGIAAGGYFFAQNQKDTDTTGVSKLEKDEGPEDGILNADESLELAVQESADAKEKSMRLVSLGSMYEQEGDNQAAIAAYEEILALNADTVSEHTANGALLYLYAEQGDFTKAKKAAEGFKAGIDESVVDEALRQAEKDYIADIIAQLNEDRVPVFSGGAGVGD